MLQPYVKNGELSGGESWGRGGVWHCPSWPGDDFGEGQNYGANLCVCPLDWSPSYWGNNTYLTVAESKIPSPADTILVAEKGRTGCDNGADSPCGGVPYLLPIEYEWTWSGVGMSGDQATSDNANRAADPSVECDDSYAASEYDWQCGEMPRYRHNGTSDMLFCDGHVKAMTKGSVKWFKNVYVSYSYSLAVWNAKDEWWTAY